VETKNLSSRKVSEDEVMQAADQLWAMQVQMDQVQLMLTVQIPPVTTVQVQLTSTE
jgi:hypothetical protein